MENFDGDGRTRFVDENDIDQTEETDEPEAIKLPKGFLPLPKMTSATSFVRGDAAELSQALIRALPATHTKPVAAEGSIFIYDGTQGVYSPLHDDYLKNIVLGFAGLWVRTRIIKDGIEGDGPAKHLQINMPACHGTVEAAKARISHPEFFEEATPGIAFKNGFAIIDAKGIGLVNHSPEHRSRHAFEFDLCEPGTEPTQLLEFLRGRFDGDDDATDKIAAIQEFIGASLCGIAAKYQRAMGWYGEGGNGKSLLIDIFTGLFPADALSSVSPQCDQYSLPRLRGALLNIVADLSTEALVDAAAFKTAVSGDLLGARDVGKAATSFRPIAGHLISMNRFPRVYDMSDGFYRRWLMIEFANKFESDEKHIAKRILSTEKAAIVSWALDGAARLIRDGYTEPKSHTTIMERWLSVSDPITGFLNEMIDPEHEPGKGMFGQALYEHYQSWFGRQKDLRERYQLESSVSFGKKIASSNRVRKSTTLRDGKSYYTVRLKS